jgi:hypothetical protein
MALRTSALVVALLASAPAARGDSATPPYPSGSECDALKAELLHNLWKRRPAPAPGRGARTVTIRYRNAYGHTADGLLVGLDGVAVLLTCAAPEGTVDVFSGLLAPGPHHLDVIYNFGPGRIGRTPAAFKVKPGRDVSITVLLDRNDEEFPDAHVEVSKTAPAARP